MRKTPSCKGFSLLELLVVIGIIGVLLSLILAGVQQARAAAARVQCADNLRQVGIALHGYHDSHSVLPPGIRLPPDSQAFLTWQARLLPHLEQQALWEQTERDFRAQPNFWGPPRHPGMSVIVKAFVCPADGRDLGMPMPENVTVAFTHYLGVAGRYAGTNDGLFFPESRVRFTDISDGTNSTLAAGERPPSPDDRFGWWYAGVGQTLNGNADSIMGVEEYRTTFRTPTCRFGPYPFQPGNASNPCDTFHFWSRHPGGAHFLFADGSARFLRYEAAPLLPALASRAGRETVTIPD